MAGGQDIASGIRGVAPHGVDRIIDVAFSANAEMYADVLAVNGAIATYFSPSAQPSIPYFPLLF